MPIYATYAPTIKASATDPLDGHRLTGAEASVTVTIWDTDGATVLVNEEPMTYSATLKIKEEGQVKEGGWFYLWDAPPAFGSYKYRVRVVGANTGVNGQPAYRTIRVRADEAPTP